MTSPRPSLVSSTSVVSTGSYGSEEEEDPRAVATSAPSETTITVGNIHMDEKAKMPGVLHGDIANTYINFIINRAAADADAENVNDLVTDAVKVNAEAVKTFLPSGVNGYPSKSPGTKEDVEGLSRRWCYLISALVALSLITLLGTAVLSLMSWTWTSQSATPTPVIQTTVDALTTEEKLFSEIPNGPKFVTRKMWLAAPSRRPLEKNALPVRLVVVCYTATGSCSSEPECIEMIRRMQRYQQEERNYADLSYNFLVGGDGSIYWSRGFDLVGEHSGRYNNGSLGIAFIGNYINIVPNAPQIEAFHKLVQAGLQVGKIAADYSLVAQCQLKVTSAPGLALVQVMNSWPHYNSSLPVRCTRG